MDSGVEKGILLYDEHNDQFTMGYGYNGYEMILDEMGQEMYLRFDENGEWYRPADLKREWTGSAVELKCIKTKEYKN